jgi:adenine deaminase
VIEAIDHELVTGEGRVVLESIGGDLQPDLSRDILKIAVVNRYDPQVLPSVAFVRNFGLKRGAIASSVAHDSHNIIAVGCDNVSLAQAVNKVISVKGGIAAVNAQESHLLPLPVAGLMSDLDGREVAEAYREIDRFAKERLGSVLSAPFMTLSFMALPVIPAVKLSDKGLFDSRTFHFIPVCIEKQ